MNTKKGLFAAGFAIFAIILLAAMADMRGFGKPLASEMDDHFIAHGQEETGANNIVTSVVFDYRGFDTLGEASVLFAAVLGIGVLLDWARTAKKSVSDKKKASEAKKTQKTSKAKASAAAGAGEIGASEGSQGMSKIVKTMTKIIFVASVLFGIYVIINGHLTPGGGFQGGALIATGSALLIVAFGAASMQQKKGKFSVLESIGLLMFITLAFIGIKTVFFDNFLATPTPYGPNPGYLISAGVIPLMNIAVGIEVLAALTVMLILLSKAAETKKEDKEPEKEVAG